LFVTVFTHQGIAYRMLGVRSLLGNPKEFEQEYNAVLDSFSYLEERKEWLARFKGKPARTALLGGLASFELNRPRWTENTFENQREYRWLEQVGFKFFPGGAWVEVRAHWSRSDTATELEELRHDLAGRLQNAKVSAAEFTTRKGKVSGFEITGDYADLPYVM